MILAGKREGREADVTPDGSRRHSDWLGHVADVVCCVSPSTPLLSLSLALHPVLQTPATTPTGAGTDAPEPQGWKQSV